MKLYQQSTAQNVETLLAELKIAQPVYFENYVIGYRSRSLQNSSAEAPRVILFSPYADLVVAFNGNPEHRGFKNIENMAFNYDTDKFEFYESHFGQSKNPSLGTANPKKCLECHQSATRDNVDPRPNWEPYNTWPGFFGALDDNLGGFYDTEETLLKDFPAPEDHIIIDEVLNELLAYDNFEKGRNATPPSSPRYALLAPPMGASYNDKIRTQNIPFTKKLSVLNLRRVARLMTEDKEIFDFVKWNIVSRKRCYKFEVAKEVDVFLRERTTAPVTTYSGKYNMNYYLSDVVALFFEGFGIDTQDWSMDFKTGGRFAFQERFGSPNDAWVEFNQGFEKYFLSDPELKNADCERIKVEAQKRLGNFEAVKALYEKRLKQPQKPAKPLIGRCISCHVENAGVVPPIPFNDPEALKVALEKTGYKRGNLLAEIRYRLGSNATVTEQMPPAGIPTHKQKDDLLKYLSGL